MGFRVGSWATVWQKEVRSDTMTTIRLSTSRKNRETGEYEQDFSGFVAFVGTACAKKAAGLKERDRIKLGDVEVTTRWDPEKGVEYTNYRCFNFDVSDETKKPSGVEANQEDETEPTVDDIIDEDGGELPF